MAKVLVVLVLTLAHVCTPSIAWGQSFEFLDVDTNGYPAVGTRFFLIDESGMPYEHVSKTDIALLEDGVSRDVTMVESQQAAGSPLSIVFLIDRSRTMSVDGFQALKSALRSWLGLAGFGRHECALVAYDRSPVILEDLCGDRSRLTAALNGLEQRAGIGDLRAGLLTEGSGALPLLAGTRAKKKVVVVFTREGDLPKYERDEVVAAAGQEDIALFGIAVGRHASAGLAALCEGAGGTCREADDSEGAVLSALHAVLLLAQGAVPCTLTWDSDGCKTTRLLEFTYAPAAIHTQTPIVIPSVVLPSIKSTPSGYIDFGEVAPGASLTREVTVAAEHASIRVTDIVTGSVAVSVVNYGGTPPPFTLAVGEQRTLQIEYSAADSSELFCPIDITGTACAGARLFAHGGWAGKRGAAEKIRVLTPNGGEVLASGDTVSIHCDGVSPVEELRFDYSSDAGATWTRITEDATDGGSWRVPVVESAQCLFRVSAAERPTYYGDMAFVPAGRYLRGNVTGMSWSNENELPVRLIEISTAFLMSRTEITQEEYERVMGVNPSTLIWDSGPVEAVSWEDAVQYCNIRSKLEGYDTCYSQLSGDVVCDFSANGYRLPTEAEWEYACRAGTDTDFFTGNNTKWQCTELDPALDRAGWYCGNANGKPHPVALKKANFFGLYDMHGNVWEWCWDWYDPGYFSVSPDIDPTGPTSGDKKVVRGGSWAHYSQMARSPSKSAVEPSYDSHTHGFRVVRRYAE